MTSFRQISNARAYFDYIRIQEDPFSFLSNIPLMFNTNPIFEEEWLDFKGQPRDDNDAKRIWSKALSGYANTTDGLVIWGIDARKAPPRYVDAACGLRLVSDPIALESKLRDWVRDATNPPVMNIEYLSISGPTNEGFVVCLIPESDYKPHRGEFAEKHYYFRAGDDFLIAEPGLLRMLFHPQSSPRIWIEITLRYGFNVGGLEHLYREDPNTALYNRIINNSSHLILSATLINDGNATAKDLYVVVSANDDINFEQGRDWHLQENRKGRASFLAIRPIHPGEEIGMFIGNFNRHFPSKEPHRKRMGLFQ